MALIVNKFNFFGKCQDHLQNEFLSIPGSIDLYT